MYLMENEDFDFLIQDMQLPTLIDGSIKTNGGILSLKQINRRNLLPVEKNKLFTCVFSYLLYSF